jgi:diguanylate cyclase (GGDEF)-like protein
MEKVGNVLREKILVVDDTRFHRALTSDILGRVGYATVQVENGTQALEKVGVESPDLVILDSAMPDLDGLEVCRRLKGDPFTNHIPIIIFTANSSIPDKVNSLRTGADGYLGKPFTPEELVAQVEALLRRSFHFDPVTKLPAAPYLHRQIDARLAQNQPMAILYADIDRFRPFNQAYGHEAGDDVLITTAKLMVESLPARAAFVGHLGSDDFMAVMAPEGAETFAQTIVAGFRAMQKDFYSHQDFERGVIALENRRGQSVDWRLMTLSAALVSNDKRPLVNYVQVSELLSEVMRFNKSGGGGRWARDRRAQ